MVGLGQTRRSDSPDSPASKDKTRYCDSVACSTDSGARSIISFFSRVEMKAKIATARNIIPTTHFPFFFAMKPITAKLALSDKP